MATKPWKAGGALEHTAETGAAFWMTPPDEDLNQHQQAGHAENGDHQYCQKVEHWNTTEVGATQGADNQEWKQQVKTNVFDCRPDGCADDLHSEQQVSGCDDQKDRGNGV